MYSISLSKDATISYARTVIAETALLSVDDANVTCDMIRSRHTSHVVVMTVTPVKAERSVGVRVPWRDSRGKG